MSDDEDFSDELDFSELSEHTDDDKDNKEDQVDKGNSENNNGDEEGEEKQGNVAGLRHLQEMSSLLGLSALKQRADSRRQRRLRAKLRKKARKSAISDSTRVLTKASAALDLESTPVEVVVHKTQRDQPKKSKEVVNDSSSVDPESQVSLRDFRSEVFNLGMRGLRGSDEAEVAHLIRLGAKKPKNEVLPYSELKRRRKEAKVQLEQSQNEERLKGKLFRSARKSSKPENGKPKKESLKGKVVKKSLKKTFKKGLKGKQGKSGSAGGLEKLGKFDGGMLKISAKQLSLMKS